MELKGEFDEVRANATPGQAWAFDRSEYAIADLKARSAKETDGAILASLALRIGEEQGVQRAILNRVVVPETGDDIGEAAYDKFEATNPKPPG